jgi:hypothetical protein
MPERAAAGQTPERGQDNRAQSADDCADADAYEFPPPEPHELGPASPWGFALYQHHQPHPPEKTVAGAQCQQLHDQSQFVATQIPSLHQRRLVRS